MIAVKVAILFLARSLTASIVVIARSRRAGAVPVPAPPVAAPPPLGHTHMIHLVHLIRVVAEAGQSHRADEGLHPHRADSIEKVVNNRTRPARRLRSAD